MWDRRGTYRGLVGRLMERDHFEDLRFRWEYRIIMKIPGKLLRVMNWICVVQDGNSWRALVNAVMNIPVL